MDDLKKSSFRAEIALGPFLPPESRLAMDSCRLNQPMERKRGIAPVENKFLFRRLFLFVATAVLTFTGGYEMYGVVKVGGVTVLEGMLIALFLMLLAWVAFSFMSAVVGFFVLLTRRNAGLVIDRDGSLPNLSSRTAMLLPTYNEDTHDLIARLRAMYESVAVTGQGARFDWFLLSDTTDPDIWVREEMAFIALRRVCGADHLYYRHRYDNTARKSGNIADWVRRFGAAYEHMIVLDADSLMEGDTIVRLVRAMEMHPSAALIQTQPVIVNARSLFSRLQQFAGRVYGPLVAAGNAWWHGPESNYWGHNAIIRVRAFAEDAALPELRGRRPFGGHILSHDFVEAALMRRAGWAIYMAPELGGSFEEVPPSMLDFASRDRRWCQGNLQHIAVLPMRGLRWVSRIHLLTGIGAYVTAPMWLIFLILGLLISLQANYIRPEYFPKGFSLFPTWPQQDPVLAAWVFAATMGLLVVPKVLAYLVLISGGDRRHAFHGSLRLFCGILCETLLAALVAPSMMILQSGAVAEILLGRDAGWQVQRRNGGEIARGEIYRKLAAPTLWGVLMGLSAYAVSLPLLLWMSPVITGLVLAVPLGLLTSRRSSPARLFATPEDDRPPPVVHRANELAASARVEVTVALQQLREDDELRTSHLASLSHGAQNKFGRIDVPLATARAKIEQCELFDEVVSWLDKSEIRAVLNDAATLQYVLELRRARPAS
jgi:membrane glycosyltransferase